MRRLLSILVTAIRGIAVAALTVALGWSPPLSAQAPSAGSARDDEARALFQAGKVAFEDGRFEAALEYFTKAYELSPRDALLYNIGTAADRLRRDEEALRAFEQYLANLPDAPNRAEVESRVRVLRETINKSAAEPEPVAAPIPEPVAQPVAEPPPEPTAATVDQAARSQPAATTGPSTLPPWLLIGGSAAFVVTGGALLFIGLDDVSTVENAVDGTRWSEISDAHDRAPTLSGLGIGLLAAGAIGATVGAVWLTTGFDSETRLSILPTGVQLRGAL